MRNWSSQSAIIILFIVLWLLEASSISFFFYSLIYFYFFIPLDAPVENCSLVQLSDRLVETTFRFCLTIINLPSIIPQSMNTQVSKQEKCMKFYEVSNLKGTLFCCCGEKVSAQCLTYCGTTRTNFKMPTRFHELVSMDLAWNPLWFCGGSPQKNYQFPLR